MKQVSLHSLAFTLLSLLTIPSFGQATETLSPSSDATLRSDQADKSFSALPTLELYTALNEDETVKSDFIGLMSFNVPIKEGYVVKSATLKLVTERAKGSIILYPFTADVSNADTYNSHLAHVTEARGKAAITTVKLAGTSGKAVTDAGASSTLSDWVNTIDLSDYVKSVGHGNVSFLIVNAAKSTTTSVKVYTNDATDMDNTKVGFSFAAADLKPILTVEYEIDAFQKSSISGCVSDTYLRAGNTANHSSESTFEICSYTNETDASKNKDFIGLMSFKIPAEALTPEYSVQSATLRLVTERIKGNNSMNLYAFDSEFEDADTYATQENNISAARANSPIATFNTKGEWNKALTLDAVGDAYQAVDAWTNVIDLTNYVKSLTSNTFNLMLTAAENNANAEKFFTSDAADFTNEKAEITFNADDLTPRLTVIYTKLTDGIEEINHNKANLNAKAKGIYTMQGIRMTEAKQKGLYIVNGKTYFVK